MAPGLVRYSDAPHGLGVPAGGGVFIRYFGQTEIENFGVSARSDEDVGWLNVAMDNAFGVRRIERIGDLNGDRK